MLKFFNRLEKTRNFVLFLFAVLMVLGLVLFYTPVRNQYQTNLSQSAEPVGSVSGNKINIGELIRQKENYRRLSRGLTLPLTMKRHEVFGSRMTRVEGFTHRLLAVDYSARVT